MLLQPSANFWPSDHFLNSNHYLVDVMFYDCAKQGIGHWAISDNYSLLMDPVMSKIPLLDISNTSLMREIFKDNNSGWIKIGVVRDPITRLLASYFDLVTRISYSMDDNDWGWLRSKGKRKLQNDGFDETYSNQTSFSNANNIPPWLLTENKSLGKEAEPWYVIPTFAELVDSLVQNLSGAPSAFQPVSTMCGLSYSTFDSIVPFETLQVQQ